MIWLVLTILLGVIGTIAIGVGLFSSDSYARVWGFGICGVAIIVWLILTVSFSVHGVGQRKVGIVYNFAGVITGKRDPGIVWTAPYQHIKTANVGIQRENFVLGPDNAAVSKDQQPIYADLSCNYQVAPNNIIGLYKTVGPGWKETLLDSRMLQDFKEITATFTAAEITTKRDDLRKQTTSRLQAELQPYDIRQVACFITNLGYTKEYRAAVNAKNVQVQKALQAEAKVAQATAEANQEVATAEGDARSAIKRAEGNAKANRLNNKGLTAAVLMKQAIDKINKHVVVIYCQPGQICIPNGSLAPFQSALKPKGSG